ncbi:MAG: hypothetical protein ABIH08_07460 [Candidatus Omnitrophota bacterium]
MRVKIVSLVCIFCLGFTALAYAGLAVSVSGGTWAIGSAGMGAVKETSGDTWTATNEGDVYSNIYIKADGANWSPGSSAGADTFILKYDAAGSWSDPITNSGNGILLKQYLAASGTQTFDLRLTAPTSDTAGGEQSLTVTLTAAAGWFCGYPVDVNHTSGDTAPATVSITYGTVASSLTGSEKCWITQNLGATQQATSATDPTPESAGWYWQFNRKQGFKYDVTRTPSTAWIASIDETENYTDSGDNASNWNPALDPCTLLLGSGWRLPTYTEWTNADSNGVWSNYNNTYASVLKLHAAGRLSSSTGALESRGSYGTYWSSTQTSSTNGHYLYFYSGSSYMYNVNKAYGFSVRCLSD